jgi:membrane fusion protein (multidrug efflux system)
MKTNPTISIQKGPSTKLTQPNQSPQSANPTQPVRTTHGSGKHSLILGLLVLVTLGLVITSCTNSSGQEDPADATEPTTRPAIRVQAEPVTQGTIREWLTFFGNVEALSSVPVVPDTTGRIVELPIRPGDRIEQGQVIGRIDPSRPGLQYSLSPIISPISGTVVSVPGQAGAMSSPQSPVATIAQLNDVKIITQIPERFIFFMSQGNQATITTESLPGTQFSARITEISPVLNPISRTSEVTLRIPTGQTRLRPGMFVEVQILSRQANQALLIPREALVYRNEQTFVYRVVEDQSELVPITIGIQSGNQVQVVSGLAQGDLVVTRGQTILYPGAPVSLLAPSN